MQLYTIDGDLRRQDPVPQTLPLEHGLYCLTEEEFLQHFPEESAQRIIHRNLKSSRYCKADILSEHVSGTFSVPSKEEPSSRLQFSFYLDTEKILLIDDGKSVETVLRGMRDFPLSRPSTPLYFLFDLMEYLIKDDGIFLQELEEKMTDLEEDLLNGEDDDFDRKILHLRRRLAIFSSYYEQLADMGEDLQSAMPGVKHSKTHLLFGLYTDRAERLSANVRMLKEYSIQMRELHQSQIDIHQNQIMKFLTIVTTIFMPLTLITGWYGMNFIHMPELQSSYGYIAIIVVSILTVLVEYWILKIKKWLD